MSQFKNKTDLLLRGDFTDYCEIRYDINASGDPDYIGYTWRPNGSTSSPIWYIVKLSYDGGGNLTRRQQPNNGMKFEYIWDSRSSYFS